MRFWLAALVAAVLAACVSANSLPPQADTWLNAAVRLETASGHGSGTVVGPNLILTAAHVAERAKEGMTAVFRDGTARKVTLVWASEAQDIALVSFEGAPHGEVIPVSCAEPEWGQNFWWVGNPLFMNWLLRGGYIASVDDAAVEEFSGEIRQRTVPVIAQFSFGDSGSGTISSDGAVIGVVTLMVGEGSDIGGISPVSSVCGELREQSAAIRFDA